MKFSKLVLFSVCIVILCCACDKKSVSSTVYEEESHGEGLVVGADKTFLTTVATKELESSTESIYVDSSEVENAFSGNIINSGIVCEYEGWVFYCSKEYGNQMFRANLSGTKQKIGTIKGAININVSKDWVIYQAGSIYLYDINQDEIRLLVDGTCRNVIAYKDRVYYLKHENDIYRICSIGIDGKDEKVLAEDIASYLNIDGDKIYYIAGDDEGHIHKMDLDGQNNEVLSSFSGVEEMIVQDGQIYYVSNEASGYRLWGMDINGKNEHKIYDKECHNINVYEKVLYFRDEAKGMLCSISDDGSDFQELLETQCMSINLTKRWIYFFDAKDMCYYRVRKDGTGLGLVK